MKRIAKIIAFMFAFVLVLTPSVMAATPYDTYTYSINGDVLKSPDAYVPDGSSAIDSASIGLENLGADLNSVSDIETDDFGNVYIVDQGNQRIVVLDRNYNFRAIIKEFVNGDGVEDTFKNPTTTFAVKVLSTVLPNKLATTIKVSPSTTPARMLIMPVLLIVILELSLIESVA